MYFSLKFLELIKYFIAIARTGEYEIDSVELGQNLITRFYLDCQKPGQEKQLIHKYVNNPIFRIFSQIKLN